MKVEKITDKAEVSRLLPLYEFKMYNAENNHKGELTTLNGLDIEDIIYDMRKGVTVEWDGRDRVVVTYPDNVCTLKSNKLL